MSNGYDQGSSDFITLTKIMIVKLEVVDRVLSPLDSGNVVSGKLA